MARNQTQEEKPKLEHSIQSEILEELLNRGIFAFRVNTGAYAVEDRFIQYGYPGCSDIIAIVKGQFIGIEVKRPGGGKQRETQKSFQLNVENAGGRYILARSWEEVKQNLNVV